MYKREFSFLFVFAFFILFFVVTRSLTADRNFLTVCIYYFPFLLFAHSLTHYTLARSLTIYVSAVFAIVTFLVLFCFVFFSSLLFFFLFFFLHDRVVCVGTYVCIWCVYVCLVCVIADFLHFFLRAHTVCTFPLFFVRSRFFERSHTLLCVCVRECVCFGVCERGFSSLFFCVYSLALSLTYALTRLFALSLSRLLVLSLVCSLTHSLAYLSSRLLARSLTCSFSH